MLIIGADTETGLMVPGEWPPIVCLTWDTGEGERGIAIGADIAPAWARLVALAKARGGKITFHSASFDLGVFVANGIDTLPNLLDLIEAGLITCTVVRETLRSLGTRGMLPHDASLEALCKHRLGLDLSAAKGDADAWRYRYAELIGVPLSAWPRAAVDYAMDDPTHGRSLYLAQEIGVLSKVQTGHDFYVNGEFPGERDDVADDLALAITGRRGLIADAERAIPLIEATRKAVAAAKELGRAIRRPCPGEVDGNAIPLPCTGGRIGRRRCKTCRGTGVQALIRADGTKDVAYLKELVTAAYQAKGEAVPLTESGDNVSTSDDTIMQCGNEVLIDWHEAASEVDKLNSTYLPALMEGCRQPLCTRYKVCVETGRTSSGAMKDKRTKTKSGTNHQNSPRAFTLDGVKQEIGYRECFVARPGYAIVSIDFDSAEFVGLAQVLYEEFGENELRTAINAGKDPHIMLASTMTGIDYNPLKARIKAEDPEATEYRQNAKPANFGLMGMLGAKALVVYYRGHGIKLSLEKAIEYRQGWFRTWGTMRDYFASIKKICDAFEGMAIIGPTNRVVAYRSAPALANIFFQARVAILAKRALRAVVRACAPGGALFGCHPLIFIHDEVVIEVPLDRLYLADVARDIMLTAARPIVPDVLLTCQPAASLYLSKGAKTVRNEKGELILWEPTKNTKGSRKG